MTPREERGLVIAALCKLKHDNGTWVVPSQSGVEKLYRVNVQAGTCTCPDHQEHGDEAGFKCKHVFAVEFTMKREVAVEVTNGASLDVSFSDRPTKNRLWCPLAAADSAPPISVPITPTRVAEGDP